VSRAENTWKIVRTLMGRRTPGGAPGTIRGDLAIELTENLITVGLAESAAREIALFFPELD